MFFGFLLKLLGGGLIQSMIKARQDQLASANETLRIKLQGELDQLNAETERRKLTVALQQSDNQFLLMRLGKGILMLTVGFYWAARIGARLWGIDDYSVIIKNLDAQEYQISMMVLTYWFVSSTVRQIVGR